jgi:ribonucleotide monophosphatase NagD (HAD superfamily)
MVGKPEVAMYETALDRLGPGRALAVGDRLETDVVGARGAGVDVALVLTGGATREQAEAAEPRPTHIAASLADLVLG